MQKFIHIGKTGGNSLKDLLLPYQDAELVEKIHLPHRITLKEALAIQKDITVCFALREPSERFVSAFWSRLSNGRPRNNSLWSTEEAAAFQWFQTPNELAEALYCKDARLYSASRFAFSAISHLKYNYAHCFGSVANFDKLKDRIFMAWDLSEFNQRRAEFLEHLGLPLANLSSTPIHSHMRSSGPSSVDELSHLAVRNLREFWRQDFALYDHIIAHFAKEPLRRSAKKRIKALHTDASDMLQSATPEKAERPLRDLCSREPNNIKVHSKLAALLVKLKRPDEAAEIWQIVLSLDKTHLAALTALWKIDLKNKNSKLSSPFLKGAHIAEPDNLKIVDMLIRNCFDDHSQTDQSLELLETYYPTVESIANSNNSIHFSRILAANNQVTKAVDVLYHRIALQPQETNTRVILATLLGRLARVGEIEAIITPELKSGNMKMLALLARAALYRDEPQLALTYTDEMKKLQPGTSVADRSADEALRMQQELDAHPHAFANDVRVVTILGISYCGSTMLSSVLGALDGCENVGESHHITKFSRHSGHLGEFDFENGDRSALKGCDFCGQECACFDFESRKLLQQDPTNRFAKIGNRLNAKTVISSDKGRFRNVDPLQRAQAIILFRTPYNSFQSYRKRQSQQISRGTLDESILAFLATYKDRYCKYLNEHSPKDGRTLLHWEAFISDAERHLEQLCGILDLPFNPRALTERTTPQHVFGGNPLVRERVKADPNDIAIVAKDISVDEKQAFERLYRQDFDTQNIYSEMLNLYQQSFG